jgi:hypothetical protein
MKNLSESEAKKIIGVAGSNVRNGNLYSDEFLPELRGKKAIRKYKEMRENDATIGAALYAAEQVLRDVKFKVEPSDKDNEKAVEEAKFVESVLEDMDHTLDDHISEALSFLTFGFSWFEVVYKRRMGPYTNNPKKNSKYTDGRMGVRKIAPRAQWTISRFEVNDDTGDLEGIYQDVSSGYSLNSNFIPIRKSIYYRTTTLNSDATGRSILRNAYTSYQKLQTIQQYEAIGIERELAGIPHAEVPAEYLSPDATDDQVAFLNNLKTILRDVKYNEQGYLISPSDTYPDSEGNPTNQKLVSIRLMSAEGSRNIDIDPVIRRYQHDIARSILSEFIMLGSGATGSYALSKSKGDFFLRALEAYIQTIVDVLNKQLVESLWKINGLDYDLMPKITAGDVAPHDLKDLGSYLRNLNGADINLSDQMDIIDELLVNAELSTLDRDIYQQSQERKQQADLARSDYYDGPDDNVSGSEGKTPEEEAEDDPDEDKLKDQE